MLNIGVDMEGSPCSPLLCHSCKTKCGYKARVRGLSYTRLRELLFASFRGIVPEIWRIGTHSLKRSGVAAAANARRCSGSSFFASRPLV